MAISGVSPCLQHQPLGLTLLIYRQRHCLRLSLSLVVHKALLSQEQLDQKLQLRQARETGICQVRRELYAQCFDELIRQCTINCTERGLLLLRVIRFKAHLKVIVPKPIGLYIGEGWTTDDLARLPNSIRIKYCFWNQKSSSSWTGCNISMKLVCLITSVSLINHRVNLRWKIV